MSGEREKTAGSGVYARIFRGAQTRDEVRRAIVRAVRELRAAMEKEDNAAVAMAHARSLDDLPPAALARAYARAERNCTFWPAPGEIRELAGGSDDLAAALDLQWVFAYLEGHGVEGHTRNGGVRFSTNAEGRRVIEIAAAAANSAPEIPARIAAALKGLGSGDLRHGLQCAAQHPRVKGWSEWGGEPPAKAAERIERQWTRCWRQVEQSTVEQTDEIFNLRRNQ